MLSKRQFHILKTLYKTDGYLTAGELSSHLRVSVKTVRNDVVAINQYLADNNAGEIKSKAHSGVKLIINQPEWETLFSKNILQPHDSNEYTEYLFRLIYLLLKRKELSSQSFVTKTFISRTMLEKILSGARQWFDKHHIMFEVKRGKGIKISCTEFHFRLAVSEFYEQFKDLIYQQDSKRVSRFTSINNSDYSVLTELLDGFDTDLITEAITETEMEYGFRFNYSSNINLLILLSMSVIRFRKGFIVEMPQPLTCKTDGDLDELIVNRLIEKLESQFSICFPSDERDFIYFAIAISEIREFDDDKARRFAEYHEVKLCRFVVKFVNLCSEITNINLYNDKFFIKQMFLQIRPMIARLKYRIEFRNPLLKQVKIRYPNMMAVAWAAGNIFYKELGLDINEHEAAFLALHIGGAVERRSAGLKACIVCDYGIGISRIISERIERAINDLQITAVFSNRDIRKIRSEECDIIISTVPLGDTRTNKEVIVVDHLLLPSNIRDIEDKMKQIRKEKKMIKKRSMESGHTLFNSDLIHIDCEATDKEELLKMMCARLERFGYVTDDFASSVLEREKHTSTEVGNGIALPHGYSKFVNRPVVSVAKLKTPISWFDENDDVELVFLLAFDLSEEMGMKDEIIRFYRSFTSFLDNDEEAKKIKHYKTAEQWMDVFKEW